MSDAYLEFLSENSQRRFPFQEDATLLYTSVDSLPDSVVLDARGFHRDRPEIAPQLASIIGGTSSAEGAVANNWIFTFRMGPTAVPLDIAVAVPFENSIWPFRTEASVVDPNYPGSVLGRIQVTIGDGVATLAPDSDLVFAGTAKLEPSGIAELYRTQVDILKLIHQDGPTEIVGGDVVVHGGYNLEVIRVNGKLLLRASPGAGELGRFIGAIHPQTDSLCDHTVQTINRLGPDLSGQFYIKGSNGIEIVNLPAEHKVQIKIQPGSLGSLAC